ncbi:D-alanyl-D-alanine carboxypeptidase [Gottschalkia purinilytica]|uniref:D-alanyl-D-alanine carboxypeptidase n=1 Tax=Gottschalkia purinilytica TaxID=1503 RepID=A0A0L0W6A1_GOTPU|nr:M15 family metallopeptidase [Gottschalkia purinilytica]KNF07058.1 D-alanyl-D-alanine carboxypeptidase [Gottschalkia purinilytica]
MKNMISIFLKIFIVGLCISIIYNLFNKNKHIKKPSDILKKSNDILMLVNYENSLSSDYVPPNLMTPNVPFTFEGDLPKKKLRKEAAEALEEMFREAKKENIRLYGVSGYRPYEAQEQVYQERVDKVGKDKAEQYVAIPGKSEHQTGLAMDIGNKSTGDFGKSKEGKWVKNNAHLFGFIIRYPVGKEHITKINYEPWHIRYVGVEAATYIASEGITLEEFLDEKYSNKVRSHNAENIKLILKKSIETILQKIQSIYILSS